MLHYSSWIVDIKTLESLFEICLVLDILDKYSSVFNSSLECTQVEVKSTVYTGKPLMRKLTKLKIWKKLCLPDRRWGGSVISYLKYLSQQLNNSGVCSFRNLQITTVNVNNTLDSNTHYKLEPSIQTSPSSPQKCKPLHSPLILQLPSNVWFGFTLLFIIRKDITSYSITQTK